MSGLKNHLYKNICKNIVLLILSLFLVSCSSIDFFNKSKDQGEQVDQKSSQEMKISDLESQLSDIKNTQTDLNLQMQDKDKQLQKLQAHVLTLEKKIYFLEKTKPIKKTAVKKPVIKKKSAATPSLLYKKARNLFLENNFKGAADLFAEFIKNYPKNNLSGNAAYWLGECHYSMGDYKKAIVVFKNLIVKYPKSEKVPDAILKLGYSYLSLDDSNRAHHYLKKVLTKYPFSLAADKAQKKLTTFE